MRCRPTTRAKTLVSKPALQRAELVGEAVLGQRQPVQGLAHQQEGAGVLRACEEKGGAATGTGTRTGPDAGAGGCSCAWGKGAVTAFASGVAGPGI